MSKVTSQHNLSAVNPKLAQEWHPSQNGKLTPKDVTPGSNKKVWWKCTKGHEWRASIANRNKGRGCPYCCGKKICKDNCLATVNRRLAKDWHPSKNYDLTPQDVTPGSNKKAWWQCAKGHEWQAIVASRRNGVGCPYCSGRRARNDNCLQTLNPGLAKEWHPTKNDALTPKDVSLGAHKRVWWKCAKGHEWPAVVKNRSKGRSCPICSGKRPHTDNCLQTLNPLLAKEWHSTKNEGLTPVDVTSGSSKKIWWICKRGHEWQAIVSSRSSGRGCPYCNSQTSVMELRIYTELKYVFPDAKLRERLNKVECDIYIPLRRIGVEYDGKYWHKNKREKDHSKNIALEKSGVKLIRVREVGLDKITENDIIYDSAKGKEKQLVDALLKTIEKLMALSGVDQARVDWYLKESSLANNQEFIKLLDRLPSPFPGSSFAELKSELTNEWHPYKNGALTPWDVTPGSNKKVWWKCKKSHEWEATVTHRSNGTGCPFCSGLYAATENCLETVNPKLAQEWHPTKNRTLTPFEVMPMSNKKVWWQCAKGHEWQAIVGDRNNGTKCPYCSGNKPNKDNCLATLNPELSRDWHLVKNGALTPQDVTLGSGRKVWWICKKGHEWRATTANRNNGRGCPYCCGRKTCGDNCIATVNPRLATEWHPSKNGELTPYDVTPGSNKKVWWQCKQAHEWQAVVASRRNGVGCPYCARRKNNSKQLALL